MNTKLRIIAISVSIVLFAIAIYPAIAMILFGKTFTESQVMAAWSVGFIAFVFGMISTAP